MSNEALKTASQKRRQSTLFICQAGIIAALYVALTFVFAPISFGAVQVRIAEALTILPIFTPAAIPGLFVGCLIGNFLGGGIILDIIFGSIATLIGAIGTRLLRKVLVKGHPVFSFLPPIVSNALIIPFILAYAYGAPDSIIFMMGTVGLGELISVGVFGCILYITIRRYKNVLFPENN